MVLAKRAPRKAENRMRPGALGYRLVPSRRAITQRAATWRHRHRVSREATPARPEFAAYRPGLRRGDVEISSALALRPADHAPGDQRVDFALGISELGQHLGRVLAE